VTRSGSKAGAKSAPQGGQKSAGKSGGGRIVSRDAVVENEVNATYAKVGPAPSGTTRVVFLGGLGEVGRNCCAIEVNGRLMLVDVGLMFPDSDMPGIDLVLPDFTYLRDNADRIDGAILTHGHEDHVGALSYLLRDIEFPLYATQLTLNMARGRIEEAGLLGKTSFNPLVDGERRTIGAFDIEVIPVSHSVPDSIAVAFHTPAGVIMHSGDWKLDLTPIDGRTTDLAQIGAIAENHGIRLLMGDSTNAEVDGYTDSERVIGKVLRDLIRDHSGQRIVVACFASHIHRVQQVIEAAVASGRKVTTLGRSMKRNVQIARDMGKLRLSDKDMFDIERLGDFDPTKVLILSTGSQGEPMSALSTMAAGENRFVKLGEGDTVILSSHAIPGNETSVGKVINGLVHLGVDVVHSGLAKVHVSGHAKRGELKTLLSVAKPEFFIPIHGEFRMLSHHARLAMEMGMPASNVLICEDGDTVDLTTSGIDFGPTVPSGYLYVDGIVGDVGLGVLRDRKVLANEGMIVVIVTIDEHNGQIVTEPELITRGWVYAPEAETLLGEAAVAIRKALEQAMADGARDHEAMKRTLRLATGRFVNERTRRKPMIVPVVIEV
jgi:ribonuclease J